MSDKKKDFSKTLFSAGGLFLVLLIVILLNVLLSQMNFRWDATKEKLYSLSDGSKTIISGMKEVVTIKLFYSKGIENIPMQLKHFAPRLIDFLKEYENYGKGKIKLEIYNPKPDSEEEEWAQQYGIRGIDLPTGDTIYFGLVIIAQDKEETIRFMDPNREEHLEYDITHAISKVQSPEKATIGILSGLQIFGNPPSPVPMPGEPPASPPWYFLDELRKSYDVIEMSMSADTIEEDLDLLILFFTKALSEKLQYAVDQYVLGGGRLIVFADPYAMADQGPQYTSFMGIPEPVNAWGVKMSEQSTIIDFGYATRFLDRNNQVVENPVWLSLDQNAFNQDNVITAQLESMLVAISGAIEKDEKSGITYIPLIQSSPNSQLVKRFEVRQRLEKLRRNFEASGTRYDIAASLNGVFDSAFPDGPPASVGDTTREHLLKGIKESIIIVIADADMMHDNNYVEHQRFMGYEVSQVYNDNLNFLLNACELLTGNQELINIRGRGKFERPFTRVIDLEKKAQTRWMQQEQELVARIEETNEKLKALESQKDASQKFIISEEQEQEIQKFRAEKQKINKKLKEVRRNLRSDIERLGRYVKFVNIFLMPIFVSILGIIYAVAKRNKATGTTNKSK